MTHYTQNGALFSKCATYRYLLWRQWSNLLEPSKTCLFIMLNPSTADHDLGDSTIRKCVGFCQRWGFTRLKVANLFAYRSTEPRNLMAAHAIGDDAGQHVIGPGNDKALLEAVQGADCLVAAWGNYGVYLDRDKFVLSLLSAYKFQCLGVNANGTPKHPLDRRISYATPLIDYTGR